MKCGLHIGIVVAVGLLAVIVGALTGRWYRSSCSGMAGTTRLTGLEDEIRLAKELKLTPEQTTAVRDLTGKYRQTLTALCGEHCSTRERMAAVLFAPAADEPRLRELAGQMGQIQTRSDWATIEHIRRVDALLTPTQQTTFRAKVAPCVGGSCPTGLHLCGSDNK